jgi:hypothetical protein
MNKLSLVIIVSLFLVVQITAQQKLYRIQNADEEYGYINSKGDTIVPIGKYLLCQDSVIKTIGFVYGNKGIFCINTQGKELFEVFNYDNGPDIPSNGLFRIIKDGKIGYANLKGQIVIAPQYKCAWPFEKGKAQVSNNCKIVQDGEIKLWKEGDWFYIDKKGKKKLEIKN